MSENLDAVFISYLVENSADIPCGDQTLLKQHCAALHTWANARALCESPIEERMLIGLIFATNGYAFVGWPGVDEDIKFWDPRFCTLMEPQRSYGPYRCDFMLTNCVEDMVSRLVIECDGHDFHEKTKEQAAADKRRDRYFASRNIKVLRFTGSEIFRDVGQCVSEIETVLTHEMERMMVAAGILGPEILKFHERDRQR